MLAIVSTMTGRQVKVVAWMTVRMGLTSVVVVAMKEVRTEAGEEGRGTDNRWRGRG